MARSLEQTKNVNVFMSQLNAHQRAISAAEDFGDQVDRATHSVDASQPLSTTPVTAPCTPELSGGKGRGCMWTQPHGLSFTKANMTTVATNSSPTWSPHMAPYASDRRNLVAGLLH